MDRLQREIGLWCDETFPDQTDQRVTAHLLEEATELDAVVKQSLAACGVMVDDIAEEIADCMILLMALAHRCGINTAQAVSQKMRVNRERTWAFDPAYGYDKKVESTPEQPDPGPARDSGE